MSTRKLENGATYSASNIEQAQIGTPTMRRNQSLTYFKGPSKRRFDPFCSYNFQPSYELCFMPIRLGKMVRRCIAGIFQNRLPLLYSAIDHPIKVPQQMAAYDLVVHKYIRPRDRVLDIGFGAGHGLQILAKKASEVVGIDIDRKAIHHAQRLVKSNEAILNVSRYDGYHIPFSSSSFDVIVCVDVIEHVPDYMRLINEMIRVSSRAVLLSTPNCRPENTKPNGKPKNRWHLREWNPEELALILDECQAYHWEWNFINGSANGPFTFSSVPQPETQALTPVLFVCKQ